MRKKQTVKEPDPWPTRLLVFEQVLAQLLDNAEGEHYNDTILPEDKRPCRPMAICTLPVEYRRPAAPVPAWKPSDFAVEQPDPVWYNPKYQPPPVVPQPVRIVQKGMPLSRLQQCLATVAGEEDHSAGNEQGRGLGASKVALAAVKKKRPYRARGSANQAGTPEVLVHGSQTPSQPFGRATGSEDPTGPAGSNSKTASRARSPSPLIDLSQEASTSTFDHEEPARKVPRTGAEMENFLTRTKCDPERGNIQIDGIYIRDMVNYQAVYGEHGDNRVVLKKPCKVPRGSTSFKVHGLTLNAIKFFEEVDVKDPEKDEWYSFNVNKPEFVACFHLGMGRDGSPLMSWSPIYCLYQLPDGTKWAEHGYLLDEDDLAALATARGVSYPPLQLDEQQLVRKRGRYHSRLQNIEFACYGWYGAIPDNAVTENHFYWQHTIDPYTLEVVA